MGGGGGFRNKEYEDFMDFFWGGGVIKKLD